SKSNIKSRVTAPHQIWSIAESETPCESHAAIRVRRRRDTESSICFTRQTVEIEIPACDFRTCAVGTRALQFARRSTFETSRSASNAKAEYPDAAVAGSRPI